MIKTIILSFLFFILSACSRHTISPDALPSAHVNQAYQQKILIKGGKTIDKNFYLNITIPESLGITVKPSDSNDYNEITITGTPRYKGNFTIHVAGGFYAGGGAWIDKTYTFTVTD